VVNVPPLLATSSPSISNSVTFVDADAVIQSPGHVSVYRYFGH
jgi:hypothetical protein